MGQHLSWRTTWHRDDTGLYPPSVHGTPRLKFVGLSVRKIWRTSGLNTLTFVFDTGAHYCQWGGQPSYQFWCSRLIGQQLSDASRDLAILTFDLGGHSAHCWCRSSWSLCVPSLNFVGIPVRKILRIYCVSFSRPGDLDLRPWNWCTLFPVG